MASNFNSLRQHLWGFLLRYVTVSHFLFYLSPSPKRNGVINYVSTTEEEKKERGGNVKLLLDSSLLALTQIQLGFVFVCESANRWRTQLFVECQAALHVPTLEFLDICVCVSGTRVKGCVRRWSYYSCLVVDCWLCTDNRDEHSSIGNTPVYPPQGDEDSWIYIENTTSTLSTLELV